MRTARHVINRDDPALQALARSFIDLFSEHCKCRHGGDYVDSDCRVCNFVITGRTK